MDERLQQAITAIRANDNQTAQQLLAQFLKSNPNHPQGWFLLSQVVADRKQQIAFLNKTLTLDPDNKLARQKLTQLGEPTPEPETLQVAKSTLPVSEGYRDFDEQAAAGTIPGWMADQPTHAAEAPDEVQADMIMSEKPQSGVPMPQPEDIPDWLQEEPKGEWSPAAEPTVVEEPKPESHPEPEPAAAVEKPPTVTKVIEPAEPKKKAAVSSAPKITVKGMEPLPWYFWLGAIAAVIILILILYQAVGLFF